MLVAIAGKFGGCAVAARLSGFSWRDSARIGILMNTRGAELEAPLRQSGFGRAHRAES